MSWATCQWNLAEVDKSSWTVIYLWQSYKPMHFVPNTFPIVWAFVPLSAENNSCVCMNMYTWKRRAWTTYNILYETNNIWRHHFLSWLSYHTNGLFSWVQTKVKSLLVHSLHCTFTFIFMFGSAYFCSSEKSPNKFNHWTLAKRDCWFFLF